MKLKSKKIDKLLDKIELQYEEEDPKKQKLLDEIIDEISEIIVSSLNKVKIESTSEHVLDLLEESGLSKKNAARALEIAISSNFTFKIVH